MVNYDSKIIQEFADRLYKKANSIITVYTLLGIFLASPVYFLMTEADFDSTTGATLTGIVAIIGGLLGYAVGRERVFRMKLEAQNALCQLKIEQNTSGKIE
jgi:hypothetical protein